ncbi:MAG: hypothetical protein P4L79_10070 [Legionella sp.]|uniref:hypothetical protein n=1 Tax=Legionella sp. TaxID=459 RepID=UPI00284AB122|nr:hypothetical protein [Legionella sp.]
MAIRHLNRAFNAYRKAANAHAREKYVSSHGDQHGGFHSFTQTTERKLHEAERLVIKKLMIAS